MTATTKRWCGILAVAAFGLALSATTGLTCDDHKKASATAEAKPAKAAPAAEIAAAPAVTAEQGCCAKKAALAKKAEPAQPGAALPAVATTGCDKPCDGATTAGCPKKAAPGAATVAQAKPEPAKEAAPADPGKDR